MRRTALTQNPRFATLPINRSPKTPKNPIKYKKIEKILEHESIILKKVKTKFNFLQDEEIKKKEAKKIEKLQKELNRIRKEGEVKRMIKVTYISLFQPIYIPLQESKIVDRKKQIEHDIEYENQKVIDALKEKEKKALKLVEENKERLRQKLADQDMSYAQKQEKGILQIS